MEVLASRILLRPTDLAASLAFYRDTLRLSIFREFATPEGVGTVFFLSGGYLEVSGRAVGPHPPVMELWLQVRDIEATRREFGGVRILREPPRRKRFDALHKSTDADLVCFAPAGARWKLGYHRVVCLFGPPS